MAALTPGTADKRCTFQALHQSGCFVIPNPWDVGSARLLQGPGFKALATTDAGLAWSLGRPDNGVPRDLVLAQLHDRVAATDLPVNADFESGFAGAAPGQELNDCFSEGVLPRQMPWRTAVSARIVRRRTLLRAWWRWASKAGRRNSFFSTHLPARPSVPLQEAEMQAQGPFDRPMPAPAIAQTRP